MNNELVKNIGRFVVLLLAQVLIFNNIDFLGYIDPYVYVIFILLYPFKNNRTVFIFVSFIYGLLLDIFTDAGGINAAACLVIAYIRPVVLRFSFGTSYEYQAIKLNKTTIAERFTYTFILVFVHHFVLFLLEIFNISNILLTLKKTLFSSIFTILLSLLFIFLFSRKNK